MEDVTCGICLCPPEDPLMLNPCTHVICSRCMDGLQEATDDNELRCPYCRRLIILYDWCTQSFMYKKIQQLNAQWMRFSIKCHREKLANRVLIAENKAYKEKSIAEETRYPL